MKFRREVLEIHSERMHRKSKKEFREFLLQATKSLGFNAKVDGNIFAKHVVVGALQKPNIFSWHIMTLRRAFQNSFTIEYLYNMLWYTRNYFGYAWYDATRPHYWHSATNS